MSTFFSGCLEVSFRDPLTREIETTPFSSETNAPSRDIYALTNEIGQEAIAEAFLSQPAVQNSCHIGCSSLHNLQIIALRQSTRGIIFDINPDSTFFTQKTLSLLTQTSTQEDFLDQLCSFVNTTEKTGRLKFSPCFPLWGLGKGIASTVEELKFCSQDSNSWLGNPSHFAHIRKLACEGKIAVITEDICNTETFLKIVNLLECHNIIIDSLYFSNVGAWMQSNKQKTQFITTTSSLLSTPANTFVIDAKLSSDARNLIQRVKLAKELKDPSTWFFGAK
jgi:hypothetical protein